MRRVTEARVPAIALWSYMAFFLFSFFNISGLIIAVVKLESLPVQPVAFAMACVMVLPLTRSKPMSPYFVAAWIFWITFTVGGFLGPHRVASFGDKGLWQLILKLWISLVGVPYITIRCISRERVPMLVKTTVAAAAIGGVFALVQTRMSGMFSRILAEPGRGAGFWINPNNCAELLAFCLFLSLACPFKKKSVNLTMRGLIMLGILSTLSRTGLLIMVLGFIVYGITAKKMRTVLQVGVVLFVMAGAGSVLVGYLGQGKQTQATAKRLERFSNVLQGKMSGDGRENDRAQLWAYGWDAVKREPFFGRGHRTMDNVVPIGTGIGPHNYYLYVWGNSGLVALLAFLGYVVALGMMAYRCTDRNSRAAIYAITAMTATIAMLDHSFLNGQTLGPVYAVMVVISYYQAAEKKARPSFTPPLRPLPPRRPGGPAPLAT